MSLRILALVPVRDGELATGGDEVVAEVGGRVLLVGDGVRGASGALAGIARELWAWEAGPFRPAWWARALAGLLASEQIVVLPGSPDGRDLAPRIAHEMARPLLPGAVAVRQTGGGVAVDMAPGSGEVVHERHVEGAAIAVLQPGVRGVEPDPALAPAAARHLRIDESLHNTRLGLDPDLVAVLPADPATVDLAEAARIVAGGAGLGEPAVLALLGAVGLRLGASLGATRVLTDAGWLGHERQIGTTGVEVDPELYLAFGISGAVQHVMGIGDPAHVIAINTDASCPMMARADLAVVSDAPAVVRALARRLGADLDG